VPIVAPRSTTGSADEVVAKSSGTTTTIRMGG
jgi:hypothetical protein